MENSEIKYEFSTDSGLQCRACLSVGRILRPLRDLASTYLKITSECILDSPETVLICWQCSSLLKKVVLFREQVKRANDLIVTNQSFIYGPLSNLISVTVNDTHQSIYIYERNIQTNEESNEKSENKNDQDTTFFKDNHVAENLSQGLENDLENAENIISENNLLNTEVEIFQNDLNTNIVDCKPKKKHNKSRWAIKRSIQNKKPKFRISTDYDESFEKLKISNEELLRCIKKERDSEYYKSNKFKCKDCVIVFSNHKAMLKHIQKFHSHGKYTCDVCKSGTTNKRHLLSHMSKHYLVYKCIVCHYVCRRRMRLWHFEKEHKKVFQCLKCNLQFGSRRDFYNHFKESHEKFTCDYCGICFKMKYCIKDHIRKQHSPFECKPCGKKFARYNGLWLHKKIAHHPSSPAYCAECDAHYPDIYRLRWHLCNSVKHAPRNKLSIPCPSCDKVFSKKIYMSDHHNLVHLKVIKYRCDACDKNFIRNADLLKHQRIIHQGITPPKNKICYICGRGFTTNKILQNHVRTHTGERPFACKCGARFAQRASLHSHSRKHSHTTVSLSVAATS